MLLGSLIGLFLAGLLITWNVVEILNKAQAYRKLGLKPQINWNPWGMVMPTWLFVVFGAIVGLIVEKLS